MLLFARMGWRVIAVEPLSSNLRGLEANLCLHSTLKSLVTVHQAALVEQKGACEIHANSWSQGMGRLACNGERCPPDYLCHSIHTVSLDNLLAQLNVSSIDVVKSDVSGHDCGVFRGGQSLFTKYRPRIIAVETSAPGVADCMHNLSKRYSYDTRRDRYNHNTIMSPRH